MRLSFDRYNMKIRFFYSWISSYGRKNPEAQREDRQGEGPTG